MPFRDGGEWGRELGLGHAPVWQVVLLGSGKGEEGEKSMKKPVTAGKWMIMLLKNGQQNCGSGAELPVAANDHEKSKFHNAAKAVACSSLMKPK